jgi:hypothetical protein
MDCEAEGIVHIAEHVHYTAKLAEHPHGQHGDVLDEGVGGIHGAADCWEAVRESLG